MNYRCDYLSIPNLNYSILVKIAHELNKQIKQLNKQITDKPITIKLYVLNLSSWNKDIIILHSQYHGRWRISYYSDQTRLSIYMTVIFIWDMKV